MRRIWTRMAAQDFMARAMRSSAFTALGYGGQQVLRLASNLILTRLLFPEAFGMMTLVTVFMIGLNMFSDVGLSPSILQSKRGDDRDFLNTAWTIQVIRGVFLCLIATLLAYPMARFYGEPQLAQLLPVASVVLIIKGLNPTRLETANRHLMLGRVTLFELATQAIGIIAAVVLAILMQSVWALVISGIIAAIAYVVLANLFLPGEANRLCWEKSCAQELVSFGKWVFLSTVAGFLLTQGDKIVLGKFVPLDLLGIYNIGFFMASFPMLLGGMVVQRILIPVYRELAPGQAQADPRKLQKLRFGLSGALLALLGFFAFSGVWLIEFMYDPRYQLAGAILVLLTAMQVPQLVGLSYDQSALAAGASHRFFVLAASRSVLMITCLLVGVTQAGLIGAVIGQGVAWVLAYPVVVWLARKQGVWDPLHDICIATLGVLIAGGAIWLNYGEVVKLTALKIP